MDKQQVLIIEDDKDTANFFDLVFSLLGFSCQKVGAVEEAYKVLYHLQPDLILLDLRLGSSSGGEEILYKVRGDSRFDGTRVVVVTAYPVMAKPVSELADLVLLKPVEVSQLKQLTSRLLGVEVRPKAYFYRDPLTELFNRDFLITRLEHAFERARRRKDFHYAVLLLQAQLDSTDLNAERTVVLKPVYREVAARLRKSFRPTDTLAYLENGRFAGLHEELQRPEDVRILVERMTNILAAPITVGLHQYRLVPHLGAAVNSLAYAEPGDILVAAEQALARPATV